jgi:3-hydroxyisobutyrate dehydrogenase
MGAGGTWIDSSTNDARELRRLAGLAAANGVRCLEAPVTGGVHLAAAGRITVLVGGETAVFEAHRQAFEAIGGRVFHIGPLGSASVIKVITNMLAFVHLVALGEALMLAKRAGLDLRQSFEVIRASSGNSFVHETETQVILNGSYDIGFTLDLACKDLGLAHDLGREHGIPLELAGLVEQAFVRAREQYGGSAWSPMVVKLLEDALGTDLRAPGFPPRIEARAEGLGSPRPVLEAKEVQMAGVEARDFGSPDETRAPDKTRVEVVRIGGASVARMKLEPGWRWSECIKPVVGGERCQARHVGLLQSGSMHVVHDDGTEQEIGPGQAYVIEPGHDAWVVGDEPVVGFEFESRTAEEYARG